MANPSVVSLDSHAESGWKCRRAKYWKWRKLRRRLPAPASAPAATSTTTPTPAPLDRLQSLRSCVLHTELSLGRGGQEVAGESVSFLGKGRKLRAAENHRAGAVYCPYGGSGAWEKRGSRRGGETLYRHHFGALGVSLLSSPGRWWRGSPDGWAVAG